MSGVSEPSDARHGFSSAMHADLNAVHAIVLRGQQGASPAQHTQTSWNAGQPVAWKPPVSSAPEAARQLASPRSKDKLSPQSKKRALGELDPAKANQQSNLTANQQLNPKPDQEFNSTPNPQLNQTANQQPTVATTYFCDADDDALLALKY
eukprot:6175855-Pleurochrysis_carterae.AAC.1